MKFQKLFLAERKGDSYDKKIVTISITIEIAAKIMDIFLEEIHPDQILGKSSNVTDRGFTSAGTGFISYLYENSYSMNRKF